MELRCAVCELLGNSQSLRESVSSDNVDQAFDREFLADTIRAALRDKALLSQIAQRSHQHTTGFRKVVLVRCARRHQVRIHCWDAPTQEPEHVSCHNHRWDFISLVASGSIVNTSYSIIEGETDYQQFDLDIAGPAQGRSIHPRGYVGLRRTSSATIFAQESYVQPARTLHTTTALAPTVTVVLQDRARTQRSIAVQKGMPEKSQPSSLSLAELRQDLDRALSDLGQNP